MDSISNPRRSYRFTRQPKYPSRISSQGLVRRIHLHWNNKSKLWTLLRRRFCKPTMMDGCWCSWTKPSSFREARRCEPGLQQTRHCRLNTDGQLEIIWQWWLQFQWITDLNLLSISTKPPSIHRTSSISWKNSKPATLERRFLYFLTTARYTKELKYEHGWILSPT